MRSRRSSITLTVLGGLLTFGPILGLLGTAFGMFRAFNRMGEEGMNKPEALASDIGIALSTTAAGLILFPVGVVLLIFGIRDMIRHQKELKEHGISDQR